ncbi:MAG: FAD-dependent oxidoreductase, partial [Anaerolineaceae bacterium]|nr:FAD-dependent oxidoreductase [Anaerolineaceae bacterium]
RCGMHTALVEKTVFPGGLATSGLVNFYLPLCDGQGKQVSFGISEELLHLSLKYGPGHIPAGWGKLDGGQRKEQPPARLQSRFSPASFILALDEILEGSGVDLWLDTLACLPLMEGRRVTGVEVENKSGRGQIRAGCVVDATGDADLAFRAAAPCAEGDNWLSIWALQTSLEKDREAVGQTQVEDEESEFQDKDRTPVKRKHPAALLTGVHLGGDAVGNGHPEEAEKQPGTNGRSVTRFVLESRRLLRDYYQRCQAEIGREAQFPLTLPAMAQLRTTRRICGVEEMIDGQANQRRETSVGLAGDWRQRGMVWEIPYGALLPAQISGLLTAGRCIASGGDAWEVTRVIPAAAVSGQAAGAAAALAVKQKCSPEQLEPAAVQAALSTRGIPLHVDEI